MILKCIKLLTSLSVLITTSCVSVNLAKNESKKAENISFKAPKGGFSQFDSEFVDQGWRNDKNGNAITFVSDCQNAYDPSLENIESGVIGSIQDRKKVYSNKETYNDRASLRSLYSGSVDGIPTNVELVTFKKNGCIYVLSYVAVTKHYKDNKEHFQSFLAKFRAP